MSDAPQAWALSSGEEVEALVDDTSDDETFSISIRKGGQEVEKHEGLTAASVHDVQSDHFSVEAVTPPMGHPDDAG